jgi:hypothetical protein
MAMAVTSSTREPARLNPAGSKDVTGKGSEHADPSEAGSEGGFDMLQTMSRMIYSGSYVLAYGMVYAAVFVAQSLPQDNPVMHGFRDGGEAATDELSRR